MHLACKYHISQDQFMIHGSGFTKLGCCKPKQKRIPQNGKPRSQGLSLSLQGGGGGPWNKVAKWQTCFETIFNTMMHIMPKIKSKKTHLTTPFYLCPNAVKSILFPEFLGLPRCKNL